MYSHLVKKHLSTYACMAAAAFLLLFWCTTSTARAEEVGAGGDSHSESYPKIPVASQNITPTPRDRTNVELEASATAGYDNNVNRSASNTDRMGDAMSMLHLRTGFTHTSRHIRVATSLDSAARLLFNQTDYNHFVNMAAGTLWWSASRFMNLAADLDIKDRTELLSQNDYMHGGAGLRLDLHHDQLKGNWHLALKAGYRAFNYKPDHYYDNDGESFSVILSGQPAPSLASVLNLTTTMRRFQSPRLHQGPSLDSQGNSMQILMRDPQNLREDRLTILSLSLHHHGKLLMQGGGHLAVNQSNSTGSSWYRVGGHGSVGLSLPFDMFLAAKTTIQHTQINSAFQGGITTGDDTQLTPTDPLVFYNEEDTYSSAILRLTRPITDKISLEGKAGWYYTLDGSSYSRTIALLGLTCSLF